MIDLIAKYGLGQDGPWEKGWEDRSRTVPSPTKSQEPFRQRIEYLEDVVSNLQETQLALKSIEVTQIESFMKLMTDRRKQMGISDLKIMQTVGCSIETLKLIESGSLPMVSWLILYAKASGVKITALYDEVDNDSAN